MDVMLSCFVSYIYLENLTEHYGIEKTRSTTQMISQYCSQNKTCKNLVRWFKQVHGTFIDFQKLILTFTIKRTWRTLLWFHVESSKLRHYTKMISLSFAKNLNFRFYFLKSPRHSCLSHKRYELIHLNTELKFRTFKKSNSAVLQSINFANAFLFLKATAWSTNEAKFALSWQTTKSCLQISI